MGAYLLAFRESIEAALLVSIMLGVLHRSGRSASASYVWLGTALGVVASVIASFLFRTLLGGLEGRSEEFFEGIVMLVAAALITTMIVWMGNNGAALAANLKQKVESTKGTTPLALALVALLAVLREGVELVLFLSASHAEGSATVVGALLGILSAVAVAYLIYQGTLQLDLKNLFMWMGGALLLMAAGMVAGGVHELNELHIIPEGMEHVWNTGKLMSESSVLGSLLKSVVGYNSNPSLTEVAAWVLYMAAAAPVYLRKINGAKVS